MATTPTTLQSPLPSPLLAIRSHGAVSSTGSSSTQLLSSWLGQLKRLRRQQVLGHADPVTVAPCAAPVAKAQGVQRLQTLLQSAMAEALGDLPPPKNPHGWRLWLVLPAHLADADRQLLADAASAVLGRQAPEVNLLRGGPCAGWAALHQAYAACQSDAAPGASRQVIAAVDSLCDPAVLAGAADRGELLQAGQSEGHIAGEAAACVVLTPVGDARALPAGHLALHRPAAARQDQAWWPSAHQPNAQPLTAALTQALAEAGMQPQHISHLLSDMDGSDWRALLEGDALRRALGSAARPLAHWRPATTLGQVGAATGVLGWVLCAAGVRHGVQPANTVLSWAAEPGGQAAACVMESSPHQPTGAAA